MGTRPYNHAYWRKTLRKQILERDDYRCRIRLEGCTEVASCVDHIRGSKSQQAAKRPASSLVCVGKAGRRTDRRPLGPLRKLPPGGRSALTSCRANVLGISVCRWGSSTSGGPSSSSIGSAGFV